MDNFKEANKHINAALELLEVMGKHGIVLTALKDIVDQGFEISIIGIRLFKKGDSYFIETGDTPKNKPRIKANGDFWDFGLAWAYFLETKELFK